MIRYAFLCFLLIISASAIAQSIKKYVDENGHFTTKFEDAKYYASYQKINDTIYELKQYDLDDNLLVQGYYKDSLGTIPNGTFVFYKKRFKTNTSPDTSSYINAVGNYSNGFQAGLWTYYYSKDIKYYTCNYENGKLNGTYKEYYPLNNNMIELEGLFTDDKKQGEWKSYDTLGVVEITRTFMNDSLISRISHTKKLVPPDNFSSNVFKSIKKTVKKYDKNRLAIMFTVNVDGSVTDVHFNKDVSPEDSKLISDAIIAAGKFEPSIYNDKPIKDTFTVYVGGKVASDDYYPANRTQTYAKHADLIGRGLNTVGIGKPLDDK